MALNYTRELGKYGCSLGRTELLDLVVETHQILHPAWTVDELACHPTDALEFCKEVRRRAGAPIREDVILKALMNHRRKGQNN